MMKRSPQRVLSTLAITVLMPVAACAQDYKNQGYWVDDVGNIVMSPVAGMCWHSGNWTPSLAVEPCDPVAKRAVAVAAPVPVDKPIETVVVPMPAAAPKHVAVVKALPTKLSFSADALFGFDKAEIKPEGKRMLDELVLQLNGAQYEQVVLTGHADRIGNAQYNQKLSEKRATAVKAYLVEQQIPSDRISATGMGETEPTTQPAGCVRLKQPKLVLCLQPDRRVDVEMHGTKAASGG